MPPSRPFGGRVRSRIAPSARSTTKAAPRRSWPFAFLRFRKRLLQPRGPGQAGAIQGQSAQAGRFGVQMVAPRSISACAKSPGRSAGTSASVSAPDRGLRLGSGSSIAKSRATTRSTLPSTAAAALVEGDRRDRGGGIGADARQLAQLRLGRRGSAPPCASTTAWRRRGGCGRGRNSRARPRPPSPPRPAPRPAPRPSGSARGTARRTASPPRPWSAAA